MKQYQWRRSITIGVIASLLLGLVAVGLGIIMAIFRLRTNVDIDELNLLRG